MHWKEHRKNKKETDCLSQQQSANILENFIARKPKEWEDWLFPNYEGRQLKVDHLDKSFAKHSEICGVKITPYQLRHSFATLFLKNGGDVFTLQHLMGHADLRMTRRYAELDEAFVEQQHKSFSPVVLLEQAKNNRVRRIWRKAGRKPCLFLWGVVLDMSAACGRASKHSMYSFLLRNA